MFGLGGEVELLGWSGGEEGEERGVDAWSEGDAAGRGGGCGHM